MQRRRLPAVFRLAVCVSVVAPTLWCQQSTPQATAVPFNHINVSIDEAEAMTGLFEIALVKTEDFGVIGRNKITETTEAQNQALADCFDESCAVENFGVATRGKSSSTSSR